MSGLNSEVKIKGGASVMKRQPMQQTPGPVESLSGARGKVISNPFKVKDPDTGKERMDVAVAMHGLDSVGVVSVPLTHLETVTPRSSSASSAFGFGPGQSLSEQFGAEIVEMRTFTRAGKSYQRFRLTDGTVIERPTSSKKLRASASRSSTGTRSRRTTARRRSAK